MDDFDAQVQSEEIYKEWLDLHDEIDGGAEPDIDEQKEWEDFGERYDNDGPGDDWDF